MTTKITVPELPESVADAVVIDWYKKAGEYIEADDVLLELETDKIILEVPVLKAGIVKKVFAPKGSTVCSGDVLAEIEEGGEEKKIKEQDNKAKNVTKTIAEAVSNQQQKNNLSSLKSLSPSVRKYLAQHHIDPAQLIGSGKHGRILKQDVDNYIKQNNVPVNKKVSIPAQLHASTVTTPALATSTQTSNQRLSKRVPMTRLRAKIAERLLYAQQNSAILTTFNEVNMAPIIKLRKKYKQSFEQKYGVRLGFMAFFIQACVEALEKFPEINASIDDHDIVYHGYCDIGVALSAPHGLVVPVLQNAQNKSIATLEQSIVQFAEKAKTNKLTIDDITGGTFTISNGGVFGSMLSTPILNPPQSAILGMHNITERAMVVDGEITILPMMYLALSYDHRLIDGKAAVQFLATVKQQLEDPDKILLGV